MEKPELAFCSVDADLAKGRPALLAARANRLLAAFALADAVALEDVEAAALDLGRPALGAQVFLLWPRSAISRSCLGLMSVWVSK